MDSLLKKIDTAIASRDFMALASVVSSSNDANSAWNSIGGGEQRSVAAYLVKMLVSNTATVIPGAFQCYPCLRAVESILSGDNSLPTSSLENAADNKLRRLLFDYYLQQLDFMSAAKILSRTRICDDDPKSVYYLSPADRCDCEFSDCCHYCLVVDLFFFSIPSSSPLRYYWFFHTWLYNPYIVYITIAECCLQEGGDTVQADVFVTKAGAIVQQDLTFSGSTSADTNAGSSISDEHRSLLLRYKYTNARILDANRKFLQAALRYYELSQLQDSEVEEEELILLLGRAATCAILSPTGTQKQRILGLLYKDPRLSTLDSMDQFSTHSIIVRKMYTNQIVLLKGRQSPCNNDNQNVSFSSRSVLISKFQESLAEHHQQALTADGNSSIVERAFMEHNILAVGKIYNNIFITDLSYILGMADDPWMTEKLVSMMIVEGRLYASIDQVDGLLTFYLDKNDTVGTVAATEWDDSITNFCIQLNRISEDISHQYGAFQGEEITN